MAAWVFRGWACACLAIAGAACATARAGGIEVDLAGDRGAPVADAVVTLRGEGPSPAPAPRAPVTRSIDQRDETFIPYVEIFRPGDRVVFENSDSTRHHVYSFSPAGAFEFVIAPGDGSPPVTLERPGDIAVGCNIHDRMITHLYVSDAPWIAKSGADGRVRFEGLAPGRYEVGVWHPQVRPGRAPAPQEVDVGDATARVAFGLSLLPDPREAVDDRERSRY
jgi:plastocyanin